MFRPSALSGICPCSQTILWNTKSGLALGSGRLVGHVDLVLQSPLITQLDESLQRLLQRDELAHLLRSRVVTVTDVDCASFLFFGTDDWEGIQC